MRLKTVAMLLIFLSSATLAEVVLHVNFNNHPDGPYTREMAEADFPDAFWYNGMEDGRGEIVSGVSPYGQALRMLYPANTHGPHENALQIKAQLEKAVDTAWVSYMVKFGDNFDFVRGGKLPGLCGADCITGGNRPDGYNGWSARIMWRREGNVVQYMYVPENVGRDFPWDKSLPQKRFIPGQWHQVVTKIIMNTPGEYNGVVRSWLDGELALDSTSVKFRNTDELKIDQFYISTFFGGSNDSWNPPHDVYVYYDNFLVSTTKYDNTTTAQFSVSQTAGTIPFTIELDGSSSMGDLLSHEIDFGNGTILPGPVAEAQYTKPGIFNINYTVTDSENNSSTATRRIISLDEGDGLTTPVYQGKALEETIIDTTLFLNMNLTVLDTSAEIIMGPATNEGPQGIWHLFGAIRVKDGVIAAMDGTNREYDVENGYTVEKNETVRVSFQVDFSTSPMSYNAWVNGVQIGNSLPREGYALQIANYGFVSTVENAALISHVSVDRSVDEDVVSVLSHHNSKHSNPALKVTSGSGTLTISGLSGSATGNLSFFSLDGRLLSRKNFNYPQIHTFKTPGNGLYLYEIRTECGIINRGSVFSGL
ncbi:alginate lyase-like protein [Chitinispirillum alkaliphilum]|nr:alginate lyase-like protein [Chitinispirillum alkaliphilum]